MKKEWCIPPKANGAFVAQMEEVLDLYEKPYAARYPLVCMDETNKQLREDTRPCRPNPVKSHDRIMNTNARTSAISLSRLNLYVVAGMFKSLINARRSIGRISCARLPCSIISMPKKKVVVMDNLNTHGAGSFYDAFAPTEANPLTARFEFHYTPKHGGWLNMAEIELSASSRMCLNRRIPDKAMLTREVAAWERKRNAKSVTVEGRFTTEDARIKLKRLYPVISV